MLSYTFMCGNTAYDWNTIAMWRSRGGRSETSRSPIRTVPPSMRSSPARQRSSVVLPQPDGPSRTMNSPSRISRSMSFRAVVLPNTFRTDSNETLAISAHFPGPQRLNRYLRMKKMKKSDGMIMKKPPANLK